MVKNLKKKESIPLERVHSLLHPYNSCLVTSMGKNGKKNVMAVAWIIPVSVDPPMVAMSIRPERYSHDLIMETQEFVVNIPTIKLVRKVLFCGRKSGRNLNKFKETSLSTQKAKKVKAPIIKECIAHLECKLVDTVKAGDHTLILGQIVAAYALNDYFDGLYNIEKFHPCLHVGKNTFTTCINKSKEYSLGVKA